MASDEMRKKWGTIFMGEKEASVDELDAMQEPVNRERRKKQQEEEYLERVRSKAVERAREILGEAYEERRKAVEEGRAAAEATMQQAVQEGNALRAEAEAAHDTAAAASAEAEALREEARALRDAGHGEGYQAGMEQAEAELRAFRNELGQALSSVLRHIEDQFGSICALWREDLAALTQTAVEAGVGWTLETEHKRIMRSLMFEALNLLEERSVVNVRVHPDDEAFISDMFAAARERVPELSQWIVNGDPSVEPGGLTAESAGGSVDSRREHYREMLHNILSHLALPAGDLEAEGARTLAAVAAHEAARIAELAPAPEPAEEAFEEIFEPEPEASAEPATEATAAPPVELAPEAAPGAAPGAGPESVTEVTTEPAPEFPAAVMPASLAGDDAVRPDFQPETLPAASNVAPAVNAEPPSPGAAQALADATAAAQDFELPPEIAAAVKAAPDPVRPDPAEAAAVLPADTPPVPAGAASEAAAFDDEELEAVAAALAHERAEAARAVVKDPLLEESDMPRAYLPLLGEKLEDGKARKAAPSGRKKSEAGVVSGFAGTAAALFEPPPSQGALKQQKVDPSLAELEDELFPPDEPPSPAGTDAAGVAGPAEFAEPAGFAGSGDTARQDAPAAQASGEADDDILAQGGFLSAHDSGARGGA